MESKCCLFIFCKTRLTSYMLRISRIPHSLSKYQGIFNFCKVETPHTSDLFSHSVPFLDLLHDFERKTAKAIANIQDVDPTETEITKYFGFFFFSNNPQHFT